MPDSEITLDIPISQSPIPAALDMFYDMVAELAGVKEGSADKVALLGTIVTIDLDKSANLYNDYQVRAFADRSVQVSPVNWQAPANQTDRFSYRYRDMLRLLVASLDTSIPHDVQQQMEMHRATIRSVGKERDEWLKATRRDWAEYLKTIGLDMTKVDSDPATRERYMAEWVLFAKEIQYGSIMKDYRDRVQDAQQTLESIRDSAYPDDEARKISLLAKKASFYNVIRPRSPELEAKYNWDELTIQDPRYEDLEDIFDIGPLVESIADPGSVFSGKGARDFSVDTESKVTNNHDKAWSASGSGRYMSFVSGSFSASGESHFRSTIDRIRQIDVAFEHMTRLDITRGGWWASDLFDGPRVKEFLSKNPTLKQKLALLTTSLIIGRGLTLKLHFNDKSDVHEWGKTSASGKGGVKIGGYRLGGGGGKGSSWETRKIDETTQTVTFEDGPDVCRLLGVVVSPSFAIDSEELTEGARPAWSRADAAKLWMHEAAI